MVGRRCILLAKLLREYEEPLRNTVIRLLYLEVELKEYLEDRLINQFTFQRKAIDFTPYLIFKEFVNCFLES